MRTWTKSACVVLAWSILSIFVMAVWIKGSGHLDQANTRTANSSEVTLASALRLATALVTATSPTTRYVVQPGDTLSGIAARFAVRGGWPALYAANRPAIGPDPNAIHPGTVLVLPGLTALVRYTVADGDTLSGIAAEFAVRGGWPALYAANRRAIGPDPNAIHPGTVLRLPAAPSPPLTTGPARPRPRPTPPPAPPAGARHHPRPTARRAPATDRGMPQWLKVLLLAVGLCIVAAFLAEPVLVVRRRRRQKAAAQALRLVKADAGQEPQPDSQQHGTEKTRILVADHDRLVVTHNAHDGTVCVLRPPGEDPKVILKVARLVVPETSYGELAEQLGLPASWPMT